MILVKAWFLEQRNDNSLFELRWKFSSGKRQIDNVCDDRCKNLATLLEERHRNRIKIALFVQYLIVESGDFISCGKAERG